MMRNFDLFVSFALFVGVSIPAFAASDHSPSQIRKDVSRHRAMAAAHEEAAKCLESGKSPEVCHKALLASCKGLAIGKYCGMKHEH